MALEAARLRAALERPRDVMKDFDRAREEMVRWQLAERGIADRRVLAAMGSVPREDFLPWGMRGFAYEDSALPIGSGQTISQPFVVALMIEGLELVGEERALEVGTGSGYAAAVLSRCCSEVFTIERHARLARRAARRLEAYPGIHVRTGDGTLGWPAEAPFDVILVSAGSHEVPASLLEQLAVGGQLVMPVGADGSQQLMHLRRTTQRQYDREDLGPVRFVPLVSGP